LLDGEDEALLDEEDDEDDGDDDLYGDGPSVTQAAATNGVDKLDSTNSKAGDYVFRIHDTLESIAPIIDMTFGKPGPYPTSEDMTNASGVTSDLELVAATGRDKAGSLAVIHRNIQPKVIGRFEFPEARGIWTMSAKRPTPKGLQVDKEKSAMNGDYAADSQYDRLMIVSKASTDAAELSDVYALTAAGFEALTGTEFDPAAGSTIEAGTLGNGMRVIQVLKSEVRSYDGGKLPSFPQAYLLPFVLEIYCADNWRHGRSTWASQYISTFALLCRELSGNTSCPIASIKVFTTNMPICQLPLRYVVSKPKFVENGQLT
jgi:cleavage and polyadenylation specificity factor subunit 1